MTDKPVNENEEALEDGERHRRLGALLGDLVKQKGRMGAARLLGVNYKTVVRAEESGRITDHMAQALDKLLGENEGAEAPGKETLEDRIERLEGEVGELRDRVEALEPVGEGGGADERGSGEECGVGDVEEGEGHRVETGSSVPGLGRVKSFSERRVDPEIVTEEPVDDDAEVYGPAWPLVEEWRRLRTGHPHRGRSLSWLVTQKRLLVLELAMLEEHGLTLPPETQPLRGFGRRGQTGWRHTALHDTRKALRKRRLLRWVRRSLTLGLWWR